MEIGKRIKKYRTDKNLSLTELASKSGISAGFLSQIENGKSDPSLSTIKRIADELGINVYMLFDEAEEKSGSIVKCKDRVRIKNFSDDITIEFLSNFDRNNIMEACIHTVEPQKKSGEEPYSHEGQEVFFVLEGKFELTISSNTYFMNEGDSFYLEDCMTPHMFINALEDAPSKMLCVSTPPYFYDIS